MIPYPQIVPLGGNRYRLALDYIYEWAAEGGEYRLVVPAGFECDLASVPRLLWFYISPFDLGPAAVPHDWIYAHGGHLPHGSQLHRVLGVWVETHEPWTRHNCDRLFARMMREAGVSKTKRRNAYRAVRWFGRGAWRTPAPVPPLRRVHAGG